MVICRKYTQSSTDLIQTKALRSYLGVHKFAPKLGILGDVGWIPSPIRRKLCILRYWNRLINLDESRLTKIIFNNDYDLESTWCKSVRNILQEIDNVDVYKNKVQCDLINIEEKLMENYCKNWKVEILKKPKLRTYALIKREFGTEKYVRLNLTRQQRSLLAQTRLGILPLKIETGRFIGTPPNQRFCHFCPKEIENEIHFLFTCKKYVQERHSFFSHVNENILCGSQADWFQNMSLQCPRKLSKYICNLWSIRKSSLYN